MKVIFIFLSFLYLAGCARPSASVAALGCRCPKLFEAKRAPLPDGHLWSILEPSARGVSILSVWDTRKLKETIRRPISFSDTVVRVFPNEGFAALISRGSASRVELVDGEGKPLCECSTGRDTNPQDVEWVPPSSLFISRYQSPSLLRLDLASGKSSEISLAHLSANDPEGHPQMKALTRSGDKILVQVQRLRRRENHLPAADSRVAVVDTMTGAITREIVLPFSNPSSPFRWGWNGIWVACPGKYGLHRDPEGDGGLVRFNFERMEAFAVEAALKENVLDMIPLTPLGHQDTKEAILLTENQKGGTSVKRLNLLHNKVEKILMETPTFSLDGFDLDAKGMILFVGDRHNRKIRRWDLLLDMEDTPLDLGVAPNSFVFVGPAE